MTKIFGVILVFVSLNLSAQEQPLFDYGEGEDGFKWGASIPTSGKSDLKLKFGTRLQAIMEDSSVSNSAGRKVHDQDFYIRRARLQVEAKFQENLSYYMDIRADKVDKGNSGGNSFALGDAFFQIKKAFGNENLKFRLFRAKYDVSKTQTVSSSRLLNPSRVAISDFAAEYISKNRRGSNVQLLGNWWDKIKMQIVVGDSVQESSFRDSLNKTTAQLDSQSFAFGGRLRVSPFSGWEEFGLKETYFGKGKHFTLGAGHFGVNNINFVASGRSHEVDRSLTNFEASFHYGPFSIQGEFYSFDGVIDDYSSASFVEGESDGWFVQSEFVFTNFHYLAPYIRYQYWDHFKEKADFGETSTLLGLNYYMKGNKLRVGAYYDITKYEVALMSAASLDDKVTKAGVYLMMHY